MNNQKSRDEDLVDDEISKSTESAENQETEGPVEEASKVPSVEEELEKAQSLYLRARADLENYRKRASREKMEFAKFANAQLIESFLPVLDNLKLGLESAKNHPEAAAVTQGFEMVGQQLWQVLSEEGLKEVSPEGEDFDPNFHDCVTHETSEDVEEGKVLKVVRVGYMLNDKLLRPASVTVSSGPAKENKS